MRHSHTLLAIAAAVVGVSLADVATAQVQPRAQSRPLRAPQAGRQDSARAANLALRRAMVDSARVTGVGPAAGILRLRGYLSLSDDQVKRLEGLNQASVPGVDVAEMLRARADLLEANKGDGNLNAARAAMDRMNKLRTDRAVAQLKLRQDARAVLTAEQKARLDNLGARQRGMVAGRGQGAAWGRGNAMPGGMRGGQRPGSR